MKFLFILLQGTVSALLLEHIVTTVAAKVVEIILKMNLQDKMQLV